MEEEKNELSKEETSVLEEKNTNNQNSKKSNKIIIVILLFVVVVLAGFGIAKLLSSSNDNSKNKEAEIKQNDKDNNKNNDNVEKKNIEQNQQNSSNNNQEENSKEEYPQTETVIYIPVNVKYLNNTNKKYDIQLKRKKTGYQNVYDGKDNYSYGLYDKTNEKDITGFDYSNGVYYNSNNDHNGFGSVEKSCEASVINVNGNDYIYIYVVASMFESLDGAFLIYNPSNGSVIKGDTYAFGETIHYKDGQFAVMINPGQPEISEGWYYNTSRTGKPEDVIIFSKNGEFVTEKASDAEYNSDDTFTLYTMGSESEFNNANYSNFRAEIFDINGKVIKKYVNVVSTVSNYILLLENNDLVLYDINGGKNIIEQNTSKDYIYEPNMRIEDNTLKIYRQNKNNYDGWAVGEEINFEIKK